MSRRTEQVAQEIKRHISELLVQEVRDPRIGFVTVTAVEVSPDLEHATIHVSVLGSEEDEKETMKALRRASGFLRSELAKRIRLRKMAELRFEPDRSAAEAIRISQLLNQVLPPDDRQKESE